MQWNRIKQGYWWNDKVSVKQLAYITEEVEMGTTLLQHCSSVLSNEISITDIKSHWHRNFVILTTLLSLAAQKVVILSTFGAASDENAVKMTSLSFQQLTNLSPLTAPRVGILIFQFQCMIDLRDTHFWEINLYKVHLIGFKQVTTVAEFDANEIAFDWSK